MTASKSNITRRNLLALAGAAAGCRLGSTFADTDPNKPFKNPLEQAKVVWHMATLEATGADSLTLQANGAKTVTVGQKLEGAEYAESLKRGGDGFVAVFSNVPPNDYVLGTSPNGQQGWLSIGAPQAKDLRPEAAAASLYIRTFLQEPDSCGTLLFSDSIALAVHQSGLAEAFLGQKTVEGATFREVPLGIIERGKWLDLVIRIDRRQLDFFCNGVLRNSIPLGKEMGIPFESELAIGSFLGAPGGWKRHSHGLSNAKIDTIALWDRSLTDAQVAFLSGLADVRPRAKSPADQAIVAYNRFYDASESKDLDLCHRLERSMREFMRQDPTRPIYHLTAPIGWIYDPCGAFQFQGKYHVSTYHNIYAVLRLNGLDHYVSDDLVHWQMWPRGPIADTQVDVGGIWLSNHLIDDKGLPNVIYCAWGADGEERGIRARSHDGMISFTDKKVVLPDFHDGHPWKEGDTWYAITMRRVRGKIQEDPEIVLFSSTDLDHWAERGVVFRPSEYLDKDKNVGGMEFPYLFFLGDKAVLMAGCMPAGVFYWIGRFDRKSFKFIPDDPQGLRVDYANPFHCFNPSTVDAKGPNGAPRRIIMAMETRPRGSLQGLPWNGVHAMPRVLTLDGNRLRQDPLPEFETLRGQVHSLKNTRVTPETSGYLKLRGDALEIRAEFENQGASRFGVKVRLSRDGKTFVKVFYDAKTGEYGVDGNIARSLAFLAVSYPDLGRGPSYIPNGKPVQMRIFLDKALIETFVNGQPCTTSVEDTNPLNDGLDLFSEEGAAMCTRLDIWEMRSSF